MATNINKETYISLGLATALAALFIRIEVAISGLQLRMDTVEAQIVQHENTYLRKDEAMLRLESISDKLDHLEMLVLENHKK